MILTIEEKNNQVHHHFKVEKCTVLICMIAQNTFKFPFWLLYNWFNGWKNV